MDKNIGRPTKYSQKYDAQAKKLAAKGWIDTEMADFFGVAESTFYLWKERHPSFSEALKDAKAHSDSLVEDALYNRALGFEYEEVKSETGTSGDKVTTTSKKVLPDVTAQIFWLKNRQPDKWRAAPEESARGDSLADSVSKLIDKLPN